MEGNEIKEASAQAQANTDFPIIVIGASSGGFDALKELVSKLPPDLNAAIFIVWHMAPGTESVLPNVLNRYNSIQASNGHDKEPIVARRIYVAPPDKHMLIEKGRIRITHGPKENRFRPAVDPLFRSAALNYGNRVIGVILSGALDDGTVGLWTIKHFGGTTVVQDPEEAEVRGMPESALREVEVDHCVTISAMVEVLASWKQKETLNDKVVVGDHFAERNETKLASQYFNKAKEAAERAAILRLAVFGNEELSEQKFREQTKAKKKHNYP